MQITKASGIASWVWFVAGAGIAGFIGFNVACVPMDAASNGSRVFHKLFCVAATRGGWWFLEGAATCQVQPAAAAAAAAPLLPPLPLAGEPAGTPAVAAGTGTGSSTWSIT